MSNARLGSSKRGYILWRLRCYAELDHHQVGDGEDEFLGGDSCAVTEQHLMVGWLGRCRPPTVVPDCHLANIWFDESR